MFDFSNTPNSNVISSALNSTSSNAFGSTTNLSGSMSSSKTPNAPGPPQIDAKVIEFMVFFCFDTTEFDQQNRNSLHEKLANKFIHFEYKCIFI